MNQERHPGEVEVAAVVAALTVLSEEHDELSGDPRRRQHPQQGRTPWQQASLAESVAAPPAPGADAWRLSGRAR